MDVATVWRAVNRSVVVMVLGVFVQVTEVIPVPATHAVEEDMIVGRVMITIELFHTGNKGSSLKAKLAT